MFDDLEVMLKASVGEVFRKMLKTEACSVPICAGAMGADAHIVSIVGFIGDMTGVVYIYTSSTFANTMTSTMLEMDASEVTVHLRLQPAGAVDSGLDKVIMDFSAVKTADISLIKRGLEVIGLCSELFLKNLIIGSAAVTRECKNYEETKDWRFMSSFQEALSALN